MNRNEDGEPKTSQSDDPNPQDHAEERIGEDEDDDEEDSSARIERRRHMNMIHSRRKRQRRKIEVEVLKEQVASLSQQNARMRSENQMLEQAVLQARNIVELVDKHNELNEKHPPQLQQQRSDQKPPAVPSSQTVHSSDSNSMNFLSQQTQRQQIPAALALPPSAVAAVSGATGAWNPGSPFLSPMGLATAMGFPFANHPQDFIIANQHHQQQLQMQQQRQQQQQQMQLAAHQQINIAQLLEQMQRQMQNDERNTKK